MADGGAHEVTASTSNPAGASSAAGPLIFRSEVGDVGFPWAGAALLVVLAAAAIFARLRLRGAPGTRAPRWLGKSFFSLQPPAETKGGQGLRLQSSIHLTPQSQLHAIEWNGRQFLVATGASGAATLLASDPCGERPCQEETES